VASYAEQRPIAKSLVRPQKVRKIYAEDILLRFIFGGAFGGGGE
jgi:hypothetical protein